MEYLYTNAIVREIYTDLPTSHPFPGHYREMLLKLNPNDGFLKDSTMDAVLSFFSLKERDKDPLLVMTRLDRQKTCASVGRLTQCYGWTLDSKAPFAQMDQVFATAFRGENEIIDMALRQDTVRPHQDTICVPGDISIALSADVKGAILATVMRRWLHHKAALRIAVPSGVDYLGYVMAAIREIYQIFPAALRVEAGFCSYLPANVEANPRIYIGFVPENLADSSTLYLDGSSRAVVSALNTTAGRGSLDQFIKYLSVAPDAERGKFLEEVFQDVESVGSGSAFAKITPREYFALGDGLTLLTLEGTAEELLPQWRAFYENISKFPASMRGRIQEKISQTLEPAAFCKCVAREFRGKSAPQGIFEVLGSYSDLCSSHPHLADALWEETISLMHTKVPYRKIYDSLRSTRVNLSAYVNAQKKDHLFCLCIEEDLAAAKTMPVSTLPELDKALAKAKALLQEAENAPSGEETDALKAQIGSHISDLETSRGAIILSGLTADFQTVSQQPAHSPSQIAKLIEKANALLQKTETVGVIAGLPELQAEIQAFIARKTTEKDSAGALFYQIMDQLNNAGSYFAMLEVMAQKRGAALEEIQKQEIEKALDNARPSDMRQYAAAFRAQYGCSMNLNAISNQKAYVCIRIVRDICIMNKFIVSVSSGASAAEMNEKLTGYRAIAAKVSDSCGVGVLFDNTALEYSWFRKLLNLSHDETTMGRQSDLTKIFYALVDGGAYSGAHMARCVEMLNNCGLEWNDLFRRIIQGKFGDATRQQYQEAYQAILNGPSGKRNLNTMKQIVSREISKDKNAERAFNEFVSKTENPEGGSKKLLIPIIIGAVLLVVGIAVAVVLLILNGKDDPVAPTTEPVVVETTLPEPEIVYPEVFHDYAQNHGAVAKLYSGSGVMKSFLSIQETVSTALTELDEESAAVVIDRYAHAGASDAGSSLWTWDEYFFWKCWLMAEAGENGMQEVFSKADPDPAVVEILTFLYNNQPLPEPPAPTEPEIEETVQATVPNTAPASENDTADTAAATHASEETTVSAEETTVATEETVPTTEEILPTMDEIIAAITAAAEPTYVQTIADVENVLAVMDLFGTELDKTFTDHKLLLDYLLRSEPENVDVILRHYQSLPADTIVVLQGGDLEVTWDEYVFWECWVLAHDGLPVTDDSFGSELHARTLNVLTLLYNLPEGVPTEAPAESVAEPTTQPTDPVDATDSTDATDPADSTEPTAAETEEATEPEEEPLHLFGLETAAATAQATYEKAAYVYRTGIAQIAAN